MNLEGLTIALFGHLLMDALTMMGVPMLVILVCHAGLDPVSSFKIPLWHRARLPSVGQGMERDFSLIFRTFPCNLISLLHNYSENLYNFANKNGYFGEIVMKRISYNCLGVPI